jgi:hypothetical protein
MSHIISGMSKARFLANKKLQVTGRYLHVSAEARMTANPLSLKTAKEGVPFNGPALIPYVQKPGNTYKAGRRGLKVICDAAKAMRRRFRALSA